jgi:hypothetical protein
MRAHYALLAIAVCLFSGVVYADGIDTTAPTIYALVPSSSMIWPANHKMVGVTIDKLVIDDNDPAPLVFITGVGSNDPNFSADDVEITGALTLNLRAEKKGNDVRVYTITVLAVDASGNASEGVATVSVDHTGGKSSPF